MGIVYRAEHVDTGRMAALKTVRVPRAGLLQSIRREIHALARIQHPGIVRILDEGLRDGLPWYAMELLEGTTLREWTSRLDSVALNARPGAGDANPHSPGPGVAPAESSRTESNWWTQTLRDRDSLGSPRDASTPATGSTWP